MRSYETRVGSDFGDQLVTHLNPCDFFTGDSVGILIYTWDLISRSCYLLGPNIEPPYLR